MPVTAQKCASCHATMREYDTVYVLESGDVLCKPCGLEVGELGFESEVAYVRKLQDVHPDWRTG